MLVALRGGEVVPVSGIGTTPGPPESASTEPSGVEDDDASAGRRELLDQPLGWMERAGGVDVLSERPASVLGVGKQAGVERALQLLAEDEEHACPEGD